MRNLRRRTPTRVRTRLTDSQLTSRQASIRKVHRRTIGGEQLDRRRVQGDQDTSHPVDLDVVADRNQSPQAWTHRSLATHLPAAEADE